MSFTFDSISFRRFRAEPKRQSVGSIELTYHFINEHFNIHVFIHNVVHERTCSMKSLVVPK